MINEVGSCLSWDDDLQEENAESTDTQQGSERFAYWMW